MWRGTVVSLHIARAASASIQSPEHVRAVGGRGLEGDRYFNATGTFSGKQWKDQEVTLIEIEAIEALERDYGVKIRPGDARRNIVTQDVPLNHLVGRKFRVGEVLMSGVRLCEPCNHLAKLTHDEVLRGLVHRGGLRARILTDGVIRVGDVLEAA